MAWNTENSKVRLCAISVMYTVKEIYGHFQTSIQDLIKRHICNVDSWSAYEMSIICQIKNRNAGPLLRDLE